MKKHKSGQKPSNGKASKKSDAVGAPGILDVSRRSFLSGATVGGISAAALGFTGGGAPAEAHGKHHHAPKRGHSSRDRILLKDGIVLSLDKNVGDFAKADVLIEGKKIVDVRPNIHAHARVVDCKGLIVMPGFITTHHHQYEAVQRSIIADGYITFGQDAGQPEMPPAVWPWEDYRSVVQAIWTSGRFTDFNGNNWDLGGPPQHPEDCYIAELVTSLAQITQGITCATDTSQASHSPEHTDALIKGLMDSGARALYDYSAGDNRTTSPDVSKFEHPGAIGDETFGVGRLRKEFFSSDDQLITLGLNANQNPVTNRKTGATETYSGWELAKAFGCWINNHNVGGWQVLANNPGHDLAADPEIGPKLTLVHCVRWQDNEVAQVGANKTGYPNPATSQAWQRAADTGVHVSIAVPLELQMRHGMSPLQMSLNYGIMPSLSPDVDTNQSSDPFTLMRGAFNTQRGLANELAFDKSDPGRLLAPQTVTTRQVLEMATIAGAVGSGLGDKVGTLTPGKEADIVFLESHSIDIAPMNNAPGSVVTMMDTSHVKHVMVAGAFKYWNYELVGWNVDKLVRDITRARDKMLERIRAVPMPQPGKNTPINPYTPPFLDTCCYVGQNDMAPDYVLRP